MTQLGLFDVAAPAQWHSEASVTAAREIRPTAKGLRAAVMGFLIARGEKGATDEEMQTALGMEGSTQRPRRVELVRAGLVIDSGTQRETASGRKATVWRANAGGQT